MNLSSVRSTRISNARNNVNSLVKSVPFKWKLTLSQPIRNKSRSNLWTGNKNSLKRKRSRNSPRRKLLETSWRRKKKSNGSLTNKRNAKEWLTIKLNNFVPLETKKKVSSTNKSPKLRARLTVSLRSKNAAKWRWNLPSSAADNSRSSARIKKRLHPNKKTLNLPNSGAHVTKNSNWQNNRRKKKNALEWRNFQRSTRDRLVWRTNSKWMNLETSKSNLSELKPC